MLCGVELGRGGQKGGLFVALTFSVGEQLHVTCSETCFSMPILLLSSAEHLQGER